METVVVLRDKKVDGHISIDLDVEKLGIQDKKATYDEIKAYVSEKYGYKIPSLYIAQVKERVLSLIARLRRKRRSRMR